MVKKITCLTISLILAVSFMAVPSLAVESTPPVSCTVVNRAVPYTGENATGSVVTWEGNSFQTDFDAPFYGSNTSVASNSVVYPTQALSVSWRMNHFSVSSDDWFTGPVGLYVSFYYRNTDKVNGSWTNRNVTALNAFYTNPDGNQGTGTADVVQFTPAVTANNISMGYRVSFKSVGTINSPISQIGFGQSTVLAIYNATDAKWFEFVVPSCQVVTTQTSDELGALEDMADEIASQSEILSAMYGDIISVCNSIYSRLGDMHATQQLANSYFSQMVQLLNSIDSNTSNIYSLLQSQFELLKATIVTESGNIQAAINKQTQDLIKYFDDTFNSAVGVLPDDTEDTQGVIDDAHQNDEQYTADALGKFEEISATFQGFNGSVGSGVAVASTLFSRVWTAMGDYVIVYTFPLTLALALVVVGRLSRVQSKDGHNKDKGGESDG